MPLVRCPRCGEDDDLSGSRRDDRIVITCRRCDTVFDRDTTPTCRLCGSTDLEAIHTSTLREAGRGEQWAPSGVRVAWFCWDCTGRDVTSPAPVPGPNPPPGNHDDLRGLRDR
ncbi:hypothetical protein [Salsipaludibacter albus]|uniref:hypothetical protein n=1 Tax=Salsipaludibacter albus TaxID=2849650 RepID=UPI001EE49978|nr:hypothetical protein [Salsipaludibacter albus]MBY5160893.1 hypothetical protein [Salsipaludibacter albus]